MRAGRSLFDRLWTLAMTALLAVLAVCGRSEDPALVVARVGDDVLTVDALQRELPPAMSGDLKPGQIRDYVDRWVQTELFVQEARRRGMDGDPAIEEQLRRLRRQLLADLALEAVLPDSFPISDADVQAYYEENAEQFRREKAEVHLAQIVVSQLALANDIYRRTSEEAFADLARQYSEGPRASQGGDLGIVELEGLPDRLRTQVRRAKAGQVLKPIKIEDGYIIARVIEKFPEQSLKSLDLVRAEIVAELKQREYRRAYESAVRELSQRTNVWVNEDLLKRIYPSATQER